VHASIEPEPFGRVIAEAMACAGRWSGRAAAGRTRSSATAALAALGVAGGDPVALAAAIERALGDPDRAGPGPRRAGPGSPRTSI
jgi:glycosyltransferase involved in cell wall biosynthesis